MTAAGGAGRPASGPAPGSISLLIEELARAPARDLREAWDRGLHAGDAVGKFLLVREIGRGGFGVVFEARDLELGRHVAFKAIRPGPRAGNLTRAQLLRNEAEAAAQLQHANIVTLHDLGFCASGPYLVLELLRGETLRSRLERGPVPLRTAIDIGADVARALVHAHAHGVLHRDLKPGNVFLGEDGVVKVLDFGLAHVLGAGGPSGSGTPGYMAPEQLHGGPEDARTDVFALGILLHEILTGRRLFPGSSELDVAAPLPAAPPLAVPTVPQALAHLVARMLEADPARRPRDASEVLRALLEVESDASVRARRRRRRIGLAAAGLVAAVAAGTGWLIGSRERIRPRIALVDVENETDDPLLDGLSGMLTTSLEESTRIVLVPRAHVVEIASAASGGPVQRLDGAAAVESARAARVDTLLFPRIRRVAGPTPSLEILVRAVDPRSGRERFAATARSATEHAVPDLLDAISAEVRRKLGESDEEVERTRIRIAGALTRDLEAYRHYFAGQACAARPVVGQDCGAEFRKAIARDPGFALAHYELAVWSYWNGGARAEQRTAISRAIASVGLVPAREGTLIRAWSAYLEGHLDQALALYEEVTARWPEDPHAWIQIADILRRRDERGAAIPALERAARVDRDSPWAVGYLAECLGAMGRLDELREKVREWEGAPRPATLHALSIGYGWLGDPTRAADAAMRGIALGAGLLSQEDLLAAAVFAGDYAAAESRVRTLAAPESDARPLGFYGLAALDAYRGRRRAGMEELDALRRALPAIASDGLYQTLRIDYVLGDGRPGEVWREIEAFRATDESGASEHAPGLAWTGDLEHARGLAQRLRAGSPYARAYEAIAASRAGDAEGALERLRELSRAAPCATWRVPPVYWLAEVAAASGHDAEAVEAIGRFHAMYVPLTMWRSWAYPRSLVLLARSQERLGQVERAGETLDRFLALWASADPTEPLLAEARAARARLAKGKRADRAAASR